MEDENMKQDEMQRLLDSAARRGASELEALRELAEVLGVRYKPYETKEKEPPAAGND